MTKRYNASIMNMEYMLDCAYFAGMYCEDTADRDMYNYLMWGEI